MFYIYIYIYIYIHTHHVYNMMCVYMYCESTLSFVGLF